MPNSLETYRASYTAHRGVEDPRRLKRRLRKAGQEDHLYIAYTWGESQGYRRHPIANPYPKGRRHDHFERGLANSDPMGEWHGHGH